MLTRAAAVFAVRAAPALRSALPARAPAAALLRVPVAFPTPLQARFLCAAPPASPGQPQSPPAAQDVVMDVDESNFVSFVTESPVPVLLDCHAEWCGPCKQLGPALEAAVRGAGGRLRMAKLDVDANPQMAQRMNVTQLPTVFAVHEGRVVDHFIGMPPPEQLKTFMDGVLALAPATAPGAADDPATMVDAAAALLDSEDGDAVEARELLKKALAGATAAERPSPDERRVAARALAGLIRCALGDGETEAAGQIAAALRKDYGPELRDDAQITAAVSLAELSSSSGGGEAAAAGDGGLDALERAVERDGADVVARHELAQALVAAGRHEDAMEHALAIVKHDRAWNDGAGQALLVKLFEALGPEHAAVGPARKRLANMLFRDGADVVARHELAQALVAAGRHKDAMEHALAIVKHDRAWNDGAGQALLVKLFEALGPEHAAVGPARKRLANMLFV